MNYEKPKYKKDKRTKPPVSANFSPPPTQKQRLLAQADQPKPKEQKT